MATWHFYVVVRLWNVVGHSGICEACENLLVLLKHERKTQYFWCRKDVGPPFCWLSNFFKANLGDLATSLCAHTFALVTQDICQRVCDAAEPCPMKKKERGKGKEIWRRRRRDRVVKTDCVKISCRRLAVSTGLSLALSLSPLLVYISALSRIHCVSPQSLRELRSASPCVRGRMEWESTWLTPVGSLPFTSLFPFLRKRCWGRRLLTLMCFEWDDLQTSEDLILKS